TARNHAFFYCGTGCVQSVIHAVFLLFHFYFGTGTDFDNGNTAGQFGHAFQQFIFVVVRGRSGDFGTDLLDAGFHTISGAGTVNNHGVFFADHYFLGGTQYIQRGGFQRHTDFFRNHLTTGQYGNVLQHSFATVTEARGFYGGHFEGTAQVVHHQRGQRLTFNVFSDDQQRTTRLSHCFQNRDQLLQIVDFLVDQLDDHFFLVVDEVRRQEAAVELHAFNHFQFVFQAFAFFNGDHAFFTDFFHGFGNDAADGFIGVGRNSTNLSNGLGVGAGFG